MKRRASTGSLASGEDDDNFTSEFNLLDKRRILIREGPVSKREPDGKLWKTSRRYIFLFNDLFLLASKRERKSPDEYDLVSVVSMKDLRIVDLAYDDDEDPAAIEVIADVHNIFNCTVKVSILFLNPFSCD